MEYIRSKLRTVMRTEQAGQALVELLVAMGISAILLPAMATAFVASREGRAQQFQRMQASTLLRETNEAVRSIREKGWSQFAVNGTYYPTITSSTWSLTAGTQSVNGFTRQVVIADAQRNASGALVTSAGTVDPSTKKVTVTISWTTPRVSSISNEAYFTRYAGNTAWTETTQADFASGTTSSTTATATNGGQVELATAGGPAVVQTIGAGNDASATTIAQSFSANVDGGNLIVVAVTWDSTNTTTATCSDNRGNTYANATSGNNTTLRQAMRVCYAANVAGGPTTVTVTFSATSSFRRIAVSEYSGVATISPVDVTKTNNGVGTTAVDNVTSTAATTTVNGDLIYGAVMDNDGGASITAGTGFTERFDTGTGLAVQDRVQTTAGSIASTHTFSVTNRNYHAHMVAFKAAPTTPTPWAPPNIAGWYDASGTTDATDVRVSGNYAYLAHGTALRIVNISDPAAPTLTGTYTAAGIINGVFISGNYAYLATAADAAELVVVNISNPASPTANTLDLTGTNDGTNIFVSGTYAHVTRALSSTSGQNEYYVINITTPTAPSVTGSFNLSAAANAVFVNGNFAYLATAIGTAELTIMNVTTPSSPTQAGVYNTTGTAVASDVFAVGTTVYLGKVSDSGGGEFFIVNAATPASPALVGSYEAAANINGIHIDGTNAFLASSAGNAQLRVLNIATPASPTVLSSTNLTGVANEIMVSGSTAYLATAVDTRELTIIQATQSTGSGYAASGTYESGSFDAGASAAFNYLTFTVAEPASTNIRLQIAANDNNTTWNFVGPDGTAATYYDAAQTIRLGTVGRYIRYKAFFTGPGASTPALQDISINYSP